MTSVAGIDGCRGGWVVVTMPVDGDAAGGATVRTVTGLGELRADLEAGRLAAAAIDIPIGLATRCPRPVDAAARRLLGPRRSSVFSAPVRAVLGATTYADACAISRRDCGKGISKQLFNILDKIRDVDELVSPELQRGLIEMHPELSFRTLTGAPMGHAKRTPAGREERLRALATVFADVSRHTTAPPAGAKADDVIDAFVGVWSARRFASGTHFHLGGERDETGLRMEMIA